MKWQIQIDVHRPGGGVTTFARSMTKAREPRPDELIRISGLEFHANFVRQTDVSEWQVISRVSVTTTKLVRMVSQAMKDAGFKQINSFRR